jgi:hypothetical protein
LILELREIRMRVQVIKRAAFVFLLTVVLYSCGEVTSRDESSSVIARSNQVDVGDDSADLQFAAFELLSGMTRNAAETVLEQQDFECNLGECFRQVHYRDSFLAANYGVGQRKKQDGSPLNKRYESITTYGIRLLRSPIIKIDDVEGWVQIKDNYHGG